MIYDWKNNKAEALRGGVCVQEIQSLGYKKLTMGEENGRVVGHTFRGFPGLEFGQGVEIADCVFENCADLCFEGCGIKGCTFRNVWALTMQDCDVENTRFEKLRGDEVEIISLEESTLSHCAFEDIELKNGAYLGEGYGSALVDFCSFKNVRTDRADGKLFHCAKTRGKLFKRARELSIVDEDSCTGLDEVEIVDEDEE